MKITITGCCGHLGSALITELSNEHDITGIDNFATQRFSSLFGLSRSIRFIEADINSADLVKLFSKQDIVIHLAAITDAHGTANQPEKVFWTNYFGTEKVAKACREVGAKMLFPSTTSVYGKADGWVDESSTELKPQSPYAESKLRAEKMIASIPDLKFIIGRLGTIYGMSIGARFHTAINFFCFEASVGRPVSVWETAMDQYRPYLYLGDLVSAVNHIIDNDLFDGNTYNILSGNHTPREILTHIKRHRPDMEVQLTQSSIMNQLSYKVKSDLFEDTGWKPVGDLAMGIAETMDLLRGIHG